MLPFGPAYGLLKVFLASVKEVGVNMMGNKSTKQYTKLGENKQPELEIKADLDACRGF